MKNKIIFYIFIILSSCVDQNPAPIRYGSNAATHTERTIQTQQNITVKDFQKFKINDDPHIPIEDDVDSIENVKPESLPKKSFPIEEKHDKNIPDNKKEVIYHEVIEGETVESIAKKYNIHSQEIILSNKLQAPYKLEELQVLAIPLDNVVKKSEISIPQPIVEQEIDLLDEEDNDKIIHSVVDNGKIIATFDQVINGKKNKGVNIVADFRSDIKAIDAGVVLYSGFDKQLGNLIIVKSNESDVFIAYAHLDALKLAKGDVVSKNQNIGNVGKTGDIQEPQLHLSIRVNNQIINPINYLKSKK